MKWLYSKTGGLIGIGILMYTLRSENAWVHYISLGMLIIGIGVVVFVTAQGVVAMRETNKAYTQFPNTPEYAEWEKRKKMEEQQDDSKHIRIQTAVDETDKQGVISENTEKQE